jgi:aryl-alcohol dehydrogenase-like predicted oxidoreductase
MTVVSSRGGSGRLKRPLAKRDEIVLATKVGNSMSASCFPAGPKASA